MNILRISRAWPSTALAAMAMFAASTFAPQGFVADACAEIEFEATWQLPVYAAVRSEVQAWLDDAQVEEEAANTVEALWPEQLPDEARSTGAAASPDLLDRVVATFAAVDERAAELAEMCHADYNGPRLPSATWLQSVDSEFMSNNLRLYYARWLAQYGLYDEVLAEIDGLGPGDVVDPAALLFYRMVAHQQLVHPDEARAALVQLMEHKDALPRRYLQVAQLLDRDLAALDDESLDHIARRMSDIRRRLAYGRTGEHVQEIERGVLESLESKIKELEKQQQQMQQQSQSGGAMRPSQAMPGGQSGGIAPPAPADARGSVESSGWADLPPRERDQALQQIGRDFPAHYRDLIEQYFRELAAETTPPAN
jgi:hypothetical protein